MALPTERDTEKMFKALDHYRIEDALSATVTARKKAREAGIIPVAEEQTRLIGMLVQRMKNLDRRDHAFNCIESSPPPTSEGK